MFNEKAIQEIAKAQAIAAANTAVFERHGADGIFALPADFTVHDLEKHLPTRRRARGCMTTAVVKDFANYAENHAESGACVFVDQDNMQARAVLNLGTPAEPGHADNVAVLQPTKTAAMAAMMFLNGRGLAQNTAAEFFEDWPAQCRFFNDNSAEITAPKAIAAIRKITIESMRKLESEVGQLSASKSAFENVKASSGADPIPTIIYFTCEPYAGLQSREFVLRLGILASGDKPAISLRIVNLEQHQEEMAKELADKVKDAMGDMPVLVGSYKVGA